MLKTKDGYAKVIGTSYQGSSDYLLLSNGDSKAISSLSVNYATSAGNADTVDGYHASSLVKFYLSPMANDAPADSAKSWFINTMPSASGAIVYNVPGVEKTIIAGKSSGAHGHMLQLNYQDTYLRVLRYYNGSWKSTNWEKISAGYADSAGSVAWDNVTGKPSSYKPSAHTHTVFKNNLMIKGTNGISDSASIHLGIGDSDTGFKWISDGKCQIYANNSAVGEWTSGGMNWFKNPTVNGNKIWNAGNDGSGSGLDADLLDGWHLDSIRKNVGYSWLAKYRINNWSRIIKIDNYSNILLVINFSQADQASNHLYLISTGYGCGNIVQLGANGYNSNSAIKIRLTENTATSHNVEIYSTYGYNGATELSINCNYIRIDGNSTITTYLTYTAGGGTVRKEITSSYSKIVANLQGNSDTTTKLQTPRQINGTNFDGSANITTSYWGTTRTLTIGNSGKSVNGSANISWSLSEIGAADVNHTHGLLHSNLTVTLANTTTDSGWSMINSSYNGFLLKSIRTQGSAPNWIENNYAAGICFGGADTKGVVSVAYGTPYIKFAGGNGSKPVWWIRLSGISGATYNLANFNAASANKLTTARKIWGQSFDGTADISGNMSSVGQITFSALSGTNGRALLYQQMADNDYFRIYAGGTASNSGYVEIATADDGNEPIYVRQYTGVFSSVKRTLTLLDANGYTHFPSYINIGGNENNNSSPDRVWGSNGSDSYLRSYRTSALRVSYANSAGNADTVDGYHASDFATSGHKHNNYLVKTTYDYHGEINFGSSGKCCLGKFPMYDSCVTIDMAYTASGAYFGKLVIGTQNINNSRGGSWTARVFGDDSGVITYRLSIRYASGSNQFQVYFNCESWGKFVVKIHCCALASTPSDICTQVTSIPTDNLIRIIRAYNNPFNFLSSEAHIGCNGAYSDPLPGVDINFKFGGVLAATHIYSNGGFHKNGSNDSYVLLGGGGHQTISSLSVNHANSAGNAATATHASFADYICSGTLPTPANNTVKAYKDSLAKFFKDIRPNGGVGANVNVSESIISNWSNDSATYHDSSTYCFIKIGGAYAGATYGQFLLSSYNLSKVGIVGRNSSQWSKIKWLAYEDQIPTDNNQLANGAGYITSAGSCAYANSAGSVAWNSITGKPSSFTPSAHTHSWDSITGKPSSFTPSAHDHNYVLDIGNNVHTTFAHSKPGLSKDSITWLAVWNGYELRAMNKDQIALSGHTHDDRYLKLTGGTMTGNIILSSNTKIIKPLASTSNYDSIVSWSIDGETKKYGREIGLHNLGGSNSTGSIAIVPYKTDTEPWSGTVGLFIAKDTLKLDGKPIAFKSDIPSSLKNPYSLNVFGVTYDGSTAKVVSPSNFISQVTEATGTVTDGTMFITSWASDNGFADTNAVNVPYKRKAIHLWEYIKAKTDSLYTTKGHNHDDRYLKLTGGTMTGTIRFNNLINIDSAIVLDYKYSAGGFARDIVSMKNSVYGDANLGALSILCYPNSTSNGFQYIYLGTDKYDGPNNLRIYKDKVTFGNNILIDAGNIGSQSVAYASKAGNADKLDGYHASYDNNTPWGTIPVITTSGYMDIGKHLEFHRDNTTGSDYSTILMCTGNYSNIVNLPSESGTLALTKDVLIFSNESADYLSANFSNPDFSKKAASKYIECWDNAGGWWNWMAGKFMKAGSSDAYVLLGGGGHKPLSEFQLGSGSYLPYNGWWASGSGQDVNDANGMIFAYATHKNTPFSSAWGIITTFDYTYNSAYKFQLAANGYSNAMYYRSRSSDRGGWTSWAQVIDTGNISSQTVDKSYHLRVNHSVSTNSTWSTWYWIGQSGQPTWLWGTNDGINCYVWNPSNFSVKYATSAGSVSNSLNIFGVSYNGSAAKTVTTSTFVSQLEEGTSTITDGTMFITSVVSNSGFADTNAVNVPYKRKASCLWNYIDNKVSSKYLPLAGGTMNGNARIGHGSGNLYIGNSGNDGYIYTQDIASQKGTDKWSIRESGAAHFGALYIASKTDNSFNSNVIECNSTINLNYFSSQNVSLCNGGGTVQIGSYTTGDTGNNKLYVNGSEFINGASNVKDHVFANGFRHRSHNSNDSVLLAGGGYSQGVPVRYWAIYSMYIGNSSTDVTYTKRSGNYNFITSEAWESEGSARFDIRFPSGYNKSNTLIFGNGDHRTSSSWKTPVYVTITTSTAFGGASQIRVMISDDANLNVGFANIYFMCMG